MMVALQPQLGVSSFLFPSIIRRCTHIPLNFRCYLSNQACRQEAIEEQTLSFYHRKNYYPVRIGDIFHDRYRVIAKLGYGAYSTVWLASDERTKEYTTLKISVRADNAISSIPPVLNEINMLRRMRKFAEEEQDHPGLPFIRLADDILELDGPTGRHYCIAYKPQGNSVRTLQERFPNGMLPRLLVKSIIHRLFFAVNWLHASCGVAHTDISPQNILMGIEDDTGDFRYIEAEESRNPSIPVITWDDKGEVSSIVYESRPTRLEYSGYPILTDFGNMRLVEGCENKDWWMPDQYRAPEVLLQLPWGFEVDMWSIGVMTLELLEGRNLCDPVDGAHKQYVLPLAIAQYIGYLGHPPLKMLESSPLFSAYFDEHGKYVGEARVPETSLEEFVTSIASGREKELFLRFVRKMLTWDAQERATANEIIEDEWLMLTPGEMPGGMGDFALL